ncbi:hypothetical protein ACFRFU_13930 [Streptomyces sp. NPDC056704]|uniref:hypothetical protein n=1 Tax=Streptomyces TaxID=1883 RepID=UPI0036CD167A
MPERLLFAERLRRMRVRFGGEWIADSEDVVLLHEPGRYPVAHFLEGRLGFAWRAMDTFYEEDETTVQWCSTSPVSHRGGTCRLLRSPSIAPRRRSPPHREA